MQHKIKCRIFDAQIKCRCNSKHKSHPWPVFAVLGLAMVHHMNKCSYTVCTACVSSWLLLHRYIQPRNTCLPLSGSKQFLIMYGHDLEAIGAQLCAQPLLCLQNLEHLPMPTSQYIYTHVAIGFVSCNYFYTSKT